MTGLLQPNVNIANDFTVGVFIHFSWPTLIPPPVAPPVPHVEMVFPQLATVGYLMGANKFTTTVKHKALPIVQEGHDQGILIPDLSLAPPVVNFFYPLMWPFSKRKIMFASSTVKFNGENVGCSEVWRRLPMLTCGNPISAPAAWPMFNVLNTLKTGLTLGDILFGEVKILTTMGIDALFNKFFPSSKMTGSYGKELLKKLMGKMGFTPKEYFKRQVSAIAGFLFSLRGDNPTLSYSPVGGGPVPLKLKSEPGKLSINAAGVEGTYTRGEGFDGDLPLLDDPLNIIPLID